MITVARLQVSSLCKRRRSARADSLPLRVIGGIFVGIFAFSTQCVITEYADAEPKTRPLKIGAILSLTGGLTQWCQYIQQGMLLAQQDVGLDSVDILFEDDKSVDKSASVTAVHKLTYLDKVDAIFTWTSATLPQLATIAEQSHTPLIVASYASHTFQKSEYVFPAFVNYDLVGKEMVATLAALRPGGRFALITAVDTWSEGFIGPVKAALNTSGLHFVAHESVNPNDADLRSVILRLKKLHVSAIAAPLYGPALYSTLRAVKELNLNTEVHVADGMFDEDILALGAAAEGVRMSQVWLDAPALKKRYVQQFHTSATPTQLGLVAEGYDIVRHLVAAFQATKGEALTKQLRELTTNGYLGPLYLGSFPPKSLHTQLPKAP